VFAGFKITSNDGVLRLPIRARAYPIGLVHVQTLFLSTHPGFAPGSFSNVIRI
jgi:hypothetical protein